MVDASHILNISTPAVIEWVDPDGQMRYRCLQEGCPRLSTRSGPGDVITFNICFDFSNNAAFLKLRAPFTVMESKTGGSIFLFIPPERVTKLATEQPDTLPEDVKAQIVNPMRLQLHLDKPADFIGPLGQQWEEQLRLVSDVISRGSVLSIQEQADLATLYSGRGGRLVSDAESVSPTVTQQQRTTLGEEEIASKAGEQSLPPYPGLLPIPSESSGVGDVSKKRRRSSSAAGVEEHTRVLKRLVSEIYGGLGQEVYAIKQELHATKQDHAFKYEALKQEMETAKQEYATKHEAMKQSLEATKQKLYTTNLSSHRSTLDVAATKNQLEKTRQRLKEMFGLLRKTSQALRAIHDEVHEAKNDTVQYVDSSVEEVRGKLEAAKEELEEQIADIMNQTHQGLDVQVDEQLITAKSELEDFVKDELRDASTSIIRHLRDTAFYLSVESP
ncbi:hypothetical protein VMCG_01705 [Cytospora schulzeri]|uniref:Uncharacterized protein n=1 Tax=Cytospora schulzeri TaxID=448051 RepID=A0A423X3U7_9PEZI|nr:hypothetical protein VMCG_01705 [Valsa malicola]